MIEAIGWAAAILGSMVSLPQLLSILRTRETDGIALINWQNMVGVATAWLFHGWRTGAPQLLFSNFMLLVGAFWIVALVSRARQISFPRTWLQPLALACFGIAIDVTMGSTIFGLLIVLPSAYGHVASAREMLRSDSVAGVSPTYFALNTVVQILWLTFGVGSGDSALLVACILNGSLGFANLVLYAIRSRAISLQANVQPDSQPAKLVRA